MKLLTVYNCIWLKETYAFHSYSFADFSTSENYDIEEESSHSVHTQHGYEENFDTLQYEHDEEFLEDSHIEHDEEEGTLDVVEALQKQ